MHDFATPNRPFEPGAAADPLALDDPGGRLRSALGDGREPPMPAEDMVLGWLLELPAALDPAAAAARVIAGTALPARNARLLGVLQEVASWPRERLAALRCSRPARAR